MLTTQTSRSAEHQQLKISGLQRNNNSPVAWLMVLFLPSLIRPSCLYETFTYKYAVRQLIACSKMYAYFTARTLVLFFALTDLKEFNRTINFNSSKIFRESLAGEQNSHWRTRFKVTTHSTKLFRPHLFAMMCTVVLTNVHCIWLLKENTLNANHWSLRQQIWLSAGSVHLSSKTEGCKLFT